MRVENSILYWQPCIYWTNSVNKWPSLYVSWHFPWGKCNGHSTIPYGSLLLSLSWFDIIMDHTMLSVNDCPWKKIKKNISSFKQTKSTFLMLNGRLFWQSVLGLGVRQITGLLLSDRKEWCWFAYVNIWAFFLPSTWSMLCRFIAG